MANAVLFTSLFITISLIGIALISVFSQLKKLKRESISDKETNPILEHDRVILGIKKINVKEKAIEIKKVSSDNNLKIAILALMLERLKQEGLTLYVPNKEGNNETLSFNDAFFKEFEDLFQKIKKTKESFDILSYMK